MDCFSWVPELQQPPNDYEPSVWEFERWYNNLFVTSSNSQLPVVLPPIQHNQLTEQIVALLCVYVCFLNIDLRQKEKIDTSFQHPKNPGRTHDTCSWGGCRGSLIVSWRKMAPWHLVPMIKKKSGWESTFQSMPPPKKRIKWLYNSSQDHGNQKMEKLGSCGECCDEQFVFEGVATGSGGWARSPLAPNDNVKDSLMDTLNKDLPSFQEFRVKWIWNLVVMKSCDSGIVTHHNLTGLVNSEHRDFWVMMALARRMEHVGQLSFWGGHNVRHRPNQLSNVFEFTSVVEDSNETYWL